MSIRIQREVGGNLAELLLTVAETMRERDRLRRQVQALSAEGRLSGVVLITLPIGLLGFLLIAQPAYVAPLFHTQLGVLMLVMVGILMLGGIFWISRLVKIEV
jgi:tight adherence protein B